MRDPVIAYLGLGANLGDPNAALDRAVALLAATPAMVVTAQSSRYRTAPVESSGPDYINAVLAVQTQLTAPAVLACLQHIESLAGRERSFRNAPRTLDLDLLLFGDARVNSAALTIPHPRMDLRAFVLVPLHEIAPHRVAPEQLDRVREQAIERIA
jgi:2-amino-4-hydroxy-6-hydroxymethyldihydropteridine diphosphokinase